MKICRLSKKTNMVEQLSGYTIVIIIGCGAITVILLFIFAKRQIMRFAVRSRRGPHMTVGHNANKALRAEIDRRLDVIPRILHEPKLLAENEEHTVPQPFYNRLRAVDDVKVLEAEITKQDSSLRRHPSENLRAFLLTALSAPLNGCSQKIIHEFCDLYEHARHDPTEFGEEEYRMYQKLFIKLLEGAKLLKSYSSSRKSSPSRTPVRRSQDMTKSRGGLLDAKIQLQQRERDEIIARPTTLTVPMDTDNNETSV